MTTVYARPHRGRTAEWQTPPEILADLGPFDDDPLRPDSLEGWLRPWRGFVWINPPYGPEPGRFLSKLADHGHGIALVFTRTETRWFVESVWQRASSLRFLIGRPHFYQQGIRARGNSGGPMVLVGYGQQARARLEQSQLPGVLVTNWSCPSA